MRGFGRLRFVRVPLAGLVLAGLVLVAAPADETIPPTVRTTGQSALGTAGLPLRVMPLGASSTVGLGSPATAGYRGPLYTDLAADGIRVDYVGSQHTGFPGMADPDNEGHSGWTLERMIPRARGWVAAADPDVVLLHMGTNDVNTGASGATAAARLDRLLGEVFAGAPRTHVIVAGIWAALPTHLADRAEFARLVPGIVADYRAQGRSIEFVDTSNLLGGKDFTDALHANAGGYAKIATMWSTEISGWLAARRAAPLAPSSS
ncbi:SGNH/GDSL hydrolase family protein [Pseudonocardia sp. WMMC193]|uniref:SGNH/GDSL hydrolase family protein n=1 Tax=Pseudonocardia sp. WMMC193 TaxID=2911965 RepID=UPI001F34CE9B|nr:SGNH/GDSL hydrolase family protein [Pseudonocardia sp. WMMC193]MCF7553241.1 SGNH/GDSL hydrolase family protein [Pseudonocardia sp. WMMC193]